MNLDNPLVIRRPSHYLVTQPNRCDLDARKALLARAVLWDSLDSGQRYPLYRGYLWDSVVASESALRIPVNLHQRSIEDAFPSHEWVDNRFKGWKHRIIDVPMKEGLSPRSGAQRRIIGYLNRPAPTYLVHATTGIGKTFCFLSSWTRWKVPLFGVFAQKAHLETFYTEIFKFLDIPEDEVLIMDQGTRSMQAALKEAPDKYKIFLGIYRTFHNQVKKCLKRRPDGAMMLISQPLYTTLMQRAGIGALLADECHLEYQAMIATALTTNIARTTYLSATPSRTVWKEKSLVELLWPRKSRITITLEPRVVYVPISWSSNPSHRDRDLCTVMGDRFNVPGYTDYLMGMRNYPHWKSMILHFLNLRIAEGSTGAAVVVGGKLALVSRLIKDLRKHYGETKSIGNYTSLVKDKKEREKSLGSDIVVTTEKSFGASVNPLQIDTLLFCAPMSSPVWIEQIAGRLRGEEGRECLFYDLAGDGGFGKLRNQKSQRKQTMKKIAHSILDEVEYDFFKEGGG